MGLIHLGDPFSLCNMDQSFGELYNTSIPAMHLPPRLYELARQMKYLSIVKSSGLL